MSVIEDDIIYIKIHAFDELNKIYNNEALYTFFVIDNSLEQSYLMFGNNTISFMRGQMEQLFHFMEFFENGLKEYAKHATISKESKTGSF